MLNSIRFCFVLLALAALAAARVGQGTVLSHQKISAAAGGFEDTLDDDDHFGDSAAALGDLDGDGFIELAVGASGDDDGGTDRGAVWILSLDAQGTVQARKKISSVHGGFAGALSDSDAFGFSLAALGDLDQDGVTELAVGAPFSDDGATVAGAVWVLFLNTDGSVKAEQKISATAGGFTGALESDQFGLSLEALGDLDGDGVPDLAVGAPRDGDGGALHGAVWLLALHADGTVKGYQKISSLEGGFGGALDSGDLFGYALSRVGDFDGDGIYELAVGANGDDDGGNGRGAVWLLSLRADGTVETQRKISSTQGGFTGPLVNSAGFGHALSELGDLDGDGVNDLAVGCALGQTGGVLEGEVWILFLNPGGTVEVERRIGDPEGGPTIFGNALCVPADLDGDGVVDLAVGARADNDGGQQSGALWQQRGSVDPVPRHRWDRPGAAEDQQHPGWVPGQPG